MKSEDIPVPQTGGAFRLDPATGKLTKDGRTLQTETHDFTGVEAEEPVAPADATAPEPAQRKGEKA